MKTSNKILTSGLAVLFTIILACLLYAKKELKPEVIQVTQERTRTESTLEKFNGVNINGSYTVKIHKGEPKIEMNGTKVIIERTEAVVEDNVLYIRAKNNGSISFRSNWDVEIDIYTNKLISITSTGNCNIKCLDQYTENDVTLITSGNSDIEAQFIATNIDAVSTGNGTISNTGHSENLKLHQTGNGDLEFYDSPSENAVVSLIGNGNIQVFCNKKLNATVTGNGDINYKGNPDVTKSEIGNGDIEKEE